MDKIGLVDSRVQSQLMSAPCSSLERLPFQLIDLCLNFFLVSDAEKMPVLNREFRRLTGRASIESSAKSLMQQGKKMTALDGQALRVESLAGVRALVVDALVELNVSRLLFIEQKTFVHPSLRSVFGKAIMIQQALIRIQEMPVDTDPTNSQEFGLNTFLNFTESLVNLSLEQKKRLAVHKLIMKLIVEGCFRKALSLSRNLDGAENAVYYSSLIAEKLRDRERLDEAFSVNRKTSRVVGFLDILSEGEYGSLMLMVPEF